jgi:hypothetical protein
MEIIKKSEDFETFKTGYLNNKKALNIFYGITLGFNTQKKLKKTICPIKGEKESLKKNPLECLFLGYKPIAERTMSRYLRFTKYVLKKKQPNIKKNSLVEFNLIKIKNTKFLHKKEEYFYEINYFKIFIYFLEYIEEKVKNRVQELSEIIEQINTIENVNVYINEDPLTKKIYLTEKEKSKIVNFDELENNTYTPDDFADTYMGRLIDTFIRFDNLDLEIFRNTSYLDEETLKIFEKKGFFEKYHITTKDGRSFFGDKETLKITKNVEKFEDLGNYKIMKDEMSIFINCFNYHLWIRSNNYISATIKDVFEDIILDFLDKKLIYSKYKKIQIPHNDTNLIINVLDSYKLFEIHDGTLNRIYYILNGMYQINVGTGILKLNKKHQ